MIMCSELYEQLSNHPATALVRVHVKGDPEERAFGHRVGVFRAALQALLTGGDCPFQVAATKTCQGLVLESIGGDEDGPIFYMRTVQVEPESIVMPIPEAN
jgi:hypothetical protein